MIAKANEALRGVIAATPTPLDGSLRPDLEKSISFTRWLLDAGCHAVNLLGTTGEATSFDLRTRLFLMEAFSEAQDLTARMMVGVGTTSLEDTVTLAKAAEVCGFAGVLLLPPFYYKDATDEGLERYFSEVVERAARSRSQYLLYNIPQNTGLTLSPSLVSKLHSRFPDILVGVKDSSGDLNYARSLVQLAPTLKVFPSNEVVLATCKTTGFAGCISASVTAAPWLARAVYDSQLASGPAYESMVGLRKALAERGLIASVKAAVSILRNDSAWRQTCHPLVPLTFEQQQSLSDQIGPYLVQHSG